ncbi:cation:proton antiporter [Microvirga sp. STR05]|uniref:Cation:proton antiporter n=1 Tax=Hymenobacter duratus TaxID=2771356 RepID=A0ABR8JM52_9BACT|nr:cation:proton antiporter [Hymenobacter duratus]MBD2716447.1 cation:proton antiporter [Hymenobacter duratus]MBR7951362.1 cation:proton antiporter [Microvirga sp. STR05]
MSLYNLILVVLGVAILAVAWLPSLLRKYPLSYPIIFVGLGALVFRLPLGLPHPDPIQHSSFITHLTEICVTVALTGTGLKIDRKFSLWRWRAPLQLVLVLMVITIGVFTVVAWKLGGLLPASAVLLAATLAPTDPVLAGDVQVGKPGEGGEDNVRFSLTGEAGLNDGLAFPFVHLAALLLPLAALPLADGLVHWVWMDVLYRTAVGVAGGWLAGKVLSYLIFDLPHRVKINPEAYGFVALAVTLTAYGLIELLHGYGFLAVFVAAVTLRAHERSHEYHTEMHEFTDQLERLFIVVILILFGGALVNGLLAPLTWSGAALGLFLLLILRPMGGILTLGRSRVSWPERLVISFFGIRGIGSFFYLAYALSKHDFPQARELWAITGFTVLTSMVLHGALATPVMNWLDRRHGRPTAQEKEEQQLAEQEKQAAS